MTRILPSRVFGMSVKSSFMQLYLGDSSLIEFLLLYLHRHPARHFTSTPDHLSYLMSVVLVVT
jgi:hypothetical protein